MSYTRALILAPLLMAAPLVHAETQYVIEQLVVNVNSAPDSTGERVATIKSGDAVEVLERQGDQVHVHLANGTDGWVRKSYLSAEEPLQHRLGERTQEVEKLKQDVARLQGELVNARAASARSRPGIAQTNTAAGASMGAGSGANMGSGSTANPTGATPVMQAPTATTMAGARPAPAEAPQAAGSTADAAVPGEPSYFMTPPEEPARPVWHWALGSFVVALGLGFVLGWQVLDRRIRRKYGGLRIY